MTLFFQIRCQTKDPKELSTLIQELAQQTTIDPYAYLVLENAHKTLPKGHRLSKQLASITHKLTPSMQVWESAKKLKLTIESKWLLNLVEKTKDGQILRHLGKIEDSDKKRARELIWELEQQHLTRHYPHFFLLDPNQQFQVLLKDLENAIARQSGQNIELLTKECAQRTNGEGAKLRTLLLPYLKNTHPQIALKLLKLIKDHLDQETWIELHLKAIASDKGVIAGELFLQALERPDQRLALPLLTFLEQQPRLSKRLLRAITQHFPLLLEGLDPRATVAFFKTCKGLGIVLKTGGEKLLCGFREAPENPDNRDALSVALEGKALTPTELIEEQLDTYLLLSWTDKVLELLPHSSKIEQRVDALIATTRDISTLLAFLKMYPETKEENWQRIADTVHASRGKKYKEEFWIILRTRPYSSLWIQALQDLIGCNSPLLVTDISRYSKGLIDNYRETPFYLSLLEVLIESKKNTDHLFSFYTECAPLLGEHDALKTKMIPVLLKTEKPEVFLKTCELYLTLRKDPQLLLQILQKGLIFQQKEGIKEAVLSLLDKPLFHLPLIEVLLRYPFSDMYKKAILAFHHYLKASPTLSFTKQTHPTIKLLFQKLLQNKETSSMGILFLVLMDENCHHFLAPLDISTFFSKTLQQNLQMCLEQKNRLAIENAVGIFCRAYPILKLNKKELNVCIDLVLKCLVEHFCQSFQELYIEETLDFQFYNQFLEHYSELVEQFESHILCLVKALSEEYLFFSLDLLIVALSPYSSANIDKTKLASSIDALLSLMDHTLKVAQEQSRFQPILLAFVSKQLLQLIALFPEKRNKLRDLVMRFIFTSPPYVGDGVTYHLRACGALFQAACEKNLLPATEIIESVLYLMYQNPPQISRAPRDKVSAFQNMVKRVLEQKNVFTTLRLVHIVRGFQEEIGGNHPKVLIGIYKKILSAYQQHHVLSIIEVNAKKKPMHIHFDEIFFKEGEPPIPPEVLAYYIEIILAFWKLQRQNNVEFPEFFNLYEYALSLFERMNSFEDQYVSQVVQALKRGMDFDIRPLLSASKEERARLLQEWLSRVLPKTS